MLSGRVAFLAEHDGGRMQLDSCRYTAKEVREWIREMDREFGEGSRYKVRKVFIQIFDDTK